MTKTITLIMATTGALLMVACGGDSPASLFESPVEDGAEVAMETVQKNAGPDIVLNETSNKWTIWASINTADDHGISVENVKDGDVLTIEAISGVGYFAGQTGWWKVLSAIYKVSGAFVPTASETANVITAFSAATAPGDGKGDDDYGRSKPRDGYGRKLDDDGKFAKEEGGIVVCVPKASGPMYAHGGNHFENGESRSAQNLKENSEMKNNCFFPTRAREEIGVEGDGVLYIYAFDRNYRDNAGNYEVRFRIERRALSADGSSGPVGSR